MPERQAAEGLPTIPPVACIDARRAHALVIDDRVTERRTLQDALLALGVESVAARSALEVGWLLAQPGSHFDLVFIDESIARTDVAALCRSLRTNPALADAAIVMVAVQPMLVPGEDGCCDERLVRPFEGSRLAALVERAHARAALPRRDRSRQAAPASRFGSPLPVAE